MRKTVAVLTVSLLTFVLGLTASAQQTRPTEPSAQPQRQAWMPPSGTVEAKQIIGMRVKSDQGKDIGEIDQLILNPADGKVGYVVLGRGGLMGIGEQKVVLPWSDLRIQADPANRNRWVATVDQAKVDGAPRYEARRDAAPAASPATTPGSQPRPERKP
jgi:sporulation protein YlmC with PRC-barrel domain